MNLSPGDTIQIVMTVGGVPYAKTWTARSALSRIGAADTAAMLFHDLAADIDLYADEHEHEFHCAHDESKLVCLQCDETRPLGEA